MVPPNKIAIVEYLRGFAALSVAWFHLTNTYGAGWVNASGHYGWLGVEVFFVLSGFVVPFGIAQICPSYHWHDFPRFFLRRIVRLEPPYLVSICIVIALTSLSAITPGFRGLEPHWDPMRLAAHVFYIVPLTTFSWAQPVYWSLAYEFVFYVALGLLFPLISARATTTQFVIIALGVLMLINYGEVPPLCLLFVIGVGLFRSTLETRMSNVLACWGIIVAAATLLACLSHEAQAAVGGVTALAIAKGRRGRLVGAAHRTLLWLGAISYSLYLTHVPIGGRVVNLGRRLASEQWQDMLLSLAALAACLAFAWLLHQLVERPALAWSRRLVGVERRTGRDELDKQRLVQPRTSTRSS